MRDFGPDRGLLVQFLFDHSGLKLLALGLALVLFVLVRCETETMRTVQLDVVAELPALDSSQVLVSELPSKVRVDLRGPRTRLDALRLTELTPIRADLREDGRRELSLEELIRVPEPVQVVRVRPRSVQLQWRRRAERRVPIQLNVEGTPPRGLELGAGVRLDPSSVAVTGPDDEVAALQRIETDKLSVSSLGVGSYQLPVRLTALPGRLTYVDTSSITVRLDVRPVSRARPAE